MESKSHLLGIFRTQEGSDSRNSERVPCLLLDLQAKGIKLKGRMMWKRDNGTKAMLHHVRRFHRALLESQEASFVTGLLTKKRKTAGMMAELNKRTGPHVYR